MLAKLPWLIKIRINGWKAHRRPRPDNWWESSVTFDRHLQVATFNVDSPNAHLIVETRIMNSIVQARTWLLSKCMVSYTHWLWGKTHLDNENAALIGRYPASLTKRSLDCWKLYVEKAMWSLKIQFDDSQPHSMIQRWMGKSPSQKTSQTRRFRKPV